MFYMVTLTHWGFLRKQAFIHFSHTNLLYSKVKDYCEDIKNGKPEEYFISIQIVTDEYFIGVHSLTEDAPIKIRSVYKEYARTKLSNQNINGLKLIKEENFPNS